MTSVTPEVQRCVLHLSEAYDNTATWLSLAPQTQNHSGSFGIQKLFAKSHPSPLAKEQDERPNSET